MTNLRWFKTTKSNHMITLTAITLTKVVFPEYCKPTNVSSISSFQKRLFIQSSILRKNANIFANPTSSNTTLRTDFRLPYFRHMTQDGSIHPRRPSAIRIPRGPGVAFHSFLHKTIQNFNMEIKRFVLQRSNWSYNEHDRATEKRSWTVK